MPLNILHPSSNQFWKQTNTAELFAAGADVLVAGSAVFGAPDPEEAIRQMKR